MYRWHFERDYNPLTYPTRLTARRLFFADTKLDVIVNSSETVNRISYGGNGVVKDTVNR